MSKLERIFILDDQPEITEIVEEFINDKYSHVETLTLNDPKKAIEVINSEEFSLIITDHHMPIVSGIDFLENIRNGSSANKDKPIVFLTAMQKEVIAEVQDKYKDVIVLNKIDQIKKITDVIEKFIV